jgi:hypothetical protein
LFALSTRALARRLASTINNLLTHGISPPSTHAAPAAPAMTAEAATPAALLPLLQVLQVLQGFHALV